MLMDREWISRMNMSNWNMGESKDFLFVINQVKTNGHYSGIIIKKSSDDNYILNDKIEYKLSGKVKCDCDIPVYYVHKDNVIVKNGSKKKLLSDEGWKYYNDKMDEICKDDPGGCENIRTAIWFVRMEMRQRFRSITLALENASLKYNIDLALLYSRFQSNLSVWRWAKKK